MTQPQKDLEQHSTAKRFSAPDVTAWDAPRKQSLCAEKKKIPSRPIAKAKRPRKLRKARQAEVVSKQYRRDYKLGKQSPQAARDNIQQFDEKIKITLLKSGSQALPETKAITLIKIAKVTAAATTRKKPCSGQRQRVLRPDSHVPRIFDRVRAQFMEKAKVYMMEAKIHHEQKFF